MTWLQVSSTHWRTVCGRYRVIETGGSWSAFSYIDDQIETLASGYELPENAMRAVELLCTL